MLAVFEWGVEGVLILAVAIGIYIFSYWIWMFFDCITNKHLTSGERLAWSLAIFFSHVIGASIYSRAMKLKEQETEHQN